MLLIKRDLAMQTYESLVEIIRESGTTERDEALSELMQRFEQTAYRWAFEILSDSHLAQDAVQEAFISAYEHLDQLKDPAAFPGWFKRIVLTQCNRLTRRKALSSETLDDTADSAHPDPSEEFEERESKERIERALFKLPERERTVTEMFYLSEYTQREIAEQLAVPVTTVKKRLQYARERLRGEYMKGEQFRCQILSDPLVLWQASAGESYEFYVEDEDAEDEVPVLIVQGQLVEPESPLAGAGHATYSVPFYGRMDWSPFR
jgi:RNA polymerase sigma factor (sigma-70 family)